jgi:non-ribosomal peptide synthetase component E (peptide arylation enzyme)
MKKIYGQKVYAEEIEMVMLQYEAVKKALVAIDNSRIVALIEASDEISYEALDCLMAQKLMHYKIPEAVYRVSMIPLNRNGKVDRKRNIYDGTIPWLYQHKVKVQM